MKDHNEKHNKQRTHQTNLRTNEKAIFFIFRHWGIIQ